MCSFVDKSRSKGLFECGTFVTINRRAVYIEKCTYGSEEGVMNPKESSGA